MTKYEVITLLHPDLEIDLDKTLERISSVIEKSGGKNITKDVWGKRKLAYPINKQDFAVYVYWEADMPSEGPAKLDRTLNITDEVIRHLVTKHVDIPKNEEEAEDKPRKKAKAEKAESEDS